MKKILSYLFFIQDNHYLWHILNILNVLFEQHMHMYMLTKDNHSHVSMCMILNNYWIKMKEYEKNEKNEI